LDVDILISAGIKPRQKVAKVAGYRWVLVENCGKWYADLWPKHFLLAWCAFGFHHMIYGLVLGYEMAEVVAEAV
jgi:hypothetical protein